MNERPLSGGRPPRREERITSASSHPELLGGDLAMPPRPYVSLTSVNRSMSLDRSRRTWAGILAGVAVATLLVTVEFTHGTSTVDAGAEKQRLARSCLEWHLAAGVVVSRLVQSTRDADLLQVGDAVFRMRRARRNCEAGWYVLACQDYHAVTNAVPGTVMGRQVFSCARVAQSSTRQD
jgi:hypothetical protein